MNTAHQSGVWQDRIRHEEHAATTGVRDAMRRSRSSSTTGGGGGGFPSAAELESTEGGPGDGVFISAAGRGPVFHASGGRARQFKAAAPEQQPFGRPSVAVTCRLIVARNLKFTGWTHNLQGQL
jgi:hypothetical protein